MHSPIPAKKLVVVIACLCTGAPAAAQPSSRNEWLLMPQLVRGQEFAYSVEDIARYYRTYLELMEHWDAVLPGRVLRVHYEDVVEDLEGSVRRLLEFCELPFEPACLEYHRTARSVRTASSEQVRQPIFREGLDQWRHYEPWLEPLREALGDALVRYRLKENR